MNTTKFRDHCLADGSHFYEGFLPENLVWNSNKFQHAWSLHPAEYPVIMIHGKPVKIPRFQQAYGHNYRFAGQTSEAQPVPPIFQVVLDWAKANICEDLNGILLNWYDGSLGHYIGAHRDSTIGLVPRSPIVTISFGETRIFRLRPWKGKGFTDFEATNGSVFVTPWETNQRWTHEVPKSKRATGKRISVTIRAFA